jgi:hypothetical protein
MPIDHDIVQIDDLLGDENGGRRVTHKPRKLLRCTSSVWAGGAG